MWLVTGTPFSTSLYQLRNQASVLGHNVDGLQLKRGKLRDAALAPQPPEAPGPSPPPPKPSPPTPCPFATRKDTWGPLYSTVGLDNDEVVDRLKKIMIRHTKSQRIGGQVALSLPETDHATVWLDMSDDEVLTPRPSPLSLHPSPLIPHPSRLAPHPSPLTPLTPHPSPFNPHPSSLTITGAHLQPARVQGQPSTSKQ